MPQPQYLPQMNSFWLRSLIDSVTNSKYLLLYTKVQCDSVLSPSRVVCIAACWTQMSMKKKERLQLLHDKMEGFITRNVT
jgi:hypothetical protein